MTRWTAAELPDLTGRTVVVTGGNSGIGRVAAAELARAGARVTLAVRSVERGLDAAAAMPGAVDVRQLDLADLESVRAFAAGWDGPLDLLINNAGVMAVPQAWTADGFEMQFGTNHLGHFALTNLLLPQITDRVVTVASGVHRSGSIDLDDLNWRSRPYRAWAAYAQSKLANLLFTLELHRRLAAARSGVRALAAHPGWAATNLQSRTGSRMGTGLMAIGNRIFAQSADQGAWPTLYAAVEDLPGASYVGPGGRAEQRGHPALVGRSDAASDPGLARTLWAESERLTGISFPG